MSYKTSSSTPADALHPPPHQHLGSYPAVTDITTKFKSNPIGQKSLDLADQGYKSIVAPVLPYAQPSYEYIKPYVAKADSLANDSLARVDATFPIVKQDSEQIKGSILQLAFLPFRLANESKDYVWQTYVSEYKKCGGDGYVSGGKALITTGLVVTSDTLSWLSRYLQQKQEQGKHLVQEAKEHGVGAYAEVKDYAKGTYEEGKQQGAGAVKEGKDLVQGTYEEGRQQGKGVYQEGQGAYEDVKDYAKGGYEGGKSQVKGVVKEGKGAYQEAKEQGKGAYHETKEQAKGAYHETKEQGKGSVGGKTGHY